MKLSQSTLDTPAVQIAKAQAKADQYKQQAIVARAVLFDTLYPQYTTGDEGFKQQYIYYKEELTRCIAQRDDARTKSKKQALEIIRLRTLLLEDITKGEQA
jgi:hypothetical protein